jgi:hypothetical protein
MRSPQGYTCQDACRANARCNQEQQYLSQRLHGSSLLLNLLYIGR